MARPIAANAEATRQRILAGAVGLFSDRGVDGASMREIAREASVSMATVHHYFGSKADLYEACVRTMYEEMSELRHEIEAAYSPTMSPRDWVAAAVRRSYAFARRHRAATQLMMRAWLDTGELDAQKREQHLLPFLERGVEILAPLFQRPPERVRMTLLALNYLVPRFALTSSRELAMVTGDAEAGSDEAIARVEDYLVWMACTQLGIPTDPTDHPNTD